MFNGKNFEAFKSDKFMHDEIESYELIERGQNTDTGARQFNLPIVTPRYFYIVEENREEGLDQISIGLESLERAKKFKDSEYHKKTYPNSFIVCTINEG